MSLFRIALANLRFPATPDESIALTVQAIDKAASGERGDRPPCGTLQHGIVKRNAAFHTV